MPIELTQQEATIVNLMTEGWNIKQIAKKLNVKQSEVGQRMYDLRKAR
jgi:DNA-binding NarL/FixJ family response regulator